MMAGGGLALAGLARAQSAGKRLGAAPRALVMAHRGASALRPEHSLAAYAKAIADGADFIEPDLVATKDGVLVARHENNIAQTTDVASRPEFASRRATKQIDGEAVTGWFTEDFTLAELKSLRLRERLEGMREESHGFDGQFPVATFAEVVDFVAAQSATLGRTIGLIPELKHSTYFASVGLPLEARFLAAMRASAYLAKAPVIVQSFEMANLVALRRQLGAAPNVQLMQLVDGPDITPPDLAAKGDRRVWRDLLDPAGLAAIAAYAHWIAPSSRMLMGLDAQERLAAPSGLVQAAHRAGLLVGAYSFRPENAFLPADLRGPGGPGARHEPGSLAEIRAYLALGLDGFFTDDPAIGRKAVDGA